MKSIQRSLSIFILLFSSILFSMYAPNSSKAFIIDIEENKQWNMDTNDTIIYEVLSRTDLDSPLYSYDYIAINNFRNANLTLGDPYCSNLTYDVYNIEEPTSSSEMGNGFNDIGEISVFYNMSGYYKTNWRPFMMNTYLGKYPFTMSIPFVFPQNTTEQIVDINQTAQSLNISLIPSLYDSIHQDFLANHSIGNSMAYEYQIHTLPYMLMSGFNNFSQDERYIYFEKGENIINLTIGMDGFLEKAYILYGDVDEEYTIRRLNTANSRTVIDIQDELIYKVYVTNGQFNNVSAKYIKYDNMSLNQYPIISNLSSDGSVYDFSISEWVLQSSNNITLGVFVNGTDLISSHPYEDEYSLEAISELNLFPHQDYFRFYLNDTSEENILRIYNTTAINWGNKSNGYFNFTSTVSQYGSYWEYHFKYGDNGFLEGFKIFVYDEYDLILRLEYDLVDDLSTAYADTVFNVGDEFIYEMKEAVITTEGYYKYSITNITKEPNKLVNELDYLFPMTIIYAKLYKWVESDGKWVNNEYIKDMYGRGGTEEFEFSYIVDDGYCMLTKTSAFALVFDEGLDLDFFASYFGILMSGSETTYNFYQDSLIMDNQENGVYVKLKIDEDLPILSEFVGRHPSQVSADHDYHLILIDESDLPNNLLPVANFTFTKSGLEVIFNNTSDDGNGYSEILWVFGDGSNSTLLNPTHIYTKEGTYNVTLTIIDVSGDISIFSQLITVTALVDEESNLVWILVGTIGGSVVLIGIGLYINKKNQWFSRLFKSKKSKISAKSSTKIGVKASKIDDKDWYSLK